jgi:hypothetical protein
MQADVRPDYHFLLVAPNLGAEWLFDAARNYWEAFHPTIIPDFDFLIFIPPERRITVTVIARRDTAPQIGVELSRVRPNAYFDAVVYDMFDQTREELDRRAETGQPFGVPLSEPLGTPNPNGPSIPTPRLPATRPPAGFVTETPTPSPMPTDGSVTPSISEETPDNGTRAPITPTPGPIVGGS